jgi:hypothetical protein
MRNTYIYLLAVFAILTSFGNAQAQKIKIVRDPDSANILTVKKAGDDLPSGNLSDSVEKYPNGRSTLTMSPDKRYQASVFCVPSRSSEVPGCVHRVFIIDLGRLISNLKWIDNHTLSYERWVNPHFGHRYVVDIKAMKQKDAFIVSDQ